MEEQALKVTTPLIEEEMVIKKSRDGWNAKTIFRSTERPTVGYTVSTWKGNSKLVTNSQIMEFDNSGGFTSEKFMVFRDESFTVGTAQGRATERSIRLLHIESLNKWRELKANELLVNQPLKEKRAQPQDPAPKLDDKTFATFAENKMKEAATQAPAPTVTEPHEQLTFGF